MRNAELWKPVWVNYDKKKKEYAPLLDKADAKSWYINELITKEYIPYFKKYCKGKLLDAGCGKVPFYEVYKDQVDCNDCMDNNYDNSINQFVDIEADINKPWPVPDESYDTVFSTDVLAHLSNPQNLFTESARALKPDGNLVITTPFVYWLSEYPYDYYRMSEFALKDICEKNNFEVKDLRVYGGYGDVLMDTLNKGMQGRLSFRIFLLMKWFFKTFNITTRLNKKYLNNYPLGYILVATKK